MIICTTIPTAHVFGDVIAPSHRLRYRSFVSRQSYDVPVEEGMEYDQFDTLAAVYLMWRDEHGDVKGVSRLSPTDRPYMLEQLWPDMVEKIALPHSRTIYEGTRFCVDNTITDAALRSRIKHEIVLAYLEFSLAKGIEHIIGVMPPGIWAAVFARSGWQHETLGSIKTLEDGEKIVAARLPVSEAVLDNVRRRTGIREPVLVLPEQLKRQKEAA